MNRERVHFPLNVDRALGDLHDLTRGEEPTGCYFVVVDPDGREFRIDGVSFHGTPGTNRTARFTVELPELVDHDADTWLAWQHNVANGDTRLGIDAWVLHQEGDEA